MLEPGMERLIDTSGCCPRVEMVCRVQNCPAPPSCPEYHTLETNNVTGKCCPEYTCGVFQILVIFYISIIKLVSIEEMFLFWCGLFVQEGYTLDSCFLCVLSELLPVLN